MNTKKNDEISFGDNVRIRVTPITTELGLAGLEGQVFGFTTPSVTGVEVIGDNLADQAVNVAVKGGDALWFAPEMIELIDHAPGTTITIGEDPKSEFVRTELGTWIERSNSSGDK